MGRTSECRVSSDPGVFEGWNIGAVSIKRVRLGSSGAIESAVRRHGGDPAGAVRAIVQEAGPEPAGACVNGAQSSTLLSLPYVPESICTELAAGSDMRIPVEQIAALALGSANPVAPGERCAAFINSDVRSALQPNAWHGTRRRRSIWPERWSGN